MPTTSLIASLGLTLVTMPVKRRQSGGRVGRRNSPEILRNQCVDELFTSEDYTHVCGMVSVYAALRGLWSAMPYNVTASTGESLHPPYQPKGINVFVVCPYNRKREEGQMGYRQSDDCIVPMKESNVFGGKAVMQSHIKGET